MADRMQAVCGTADYVGLLLEASKWTNRAKRCNVLGDILSEPQIVLGASIDHGCGGNAYLLERGEEWCHSDLANLFWFPDVRHEIKKIR